MGAARHTQRAQEHAQRRITRDDPHSSAPELREAWREVAKDATPDARHALSQLVDSHDRWVVRAERAERERDAIARTAAKAGDVIEQVMTERDRLRAALEEVREYAWQWAGDPDEEPAVSSLVARKCIDILDRHGFGGDQ